jgi:NADPH:quinone reductase-like Zn-dependent oxidoreductase
MKAIILTREGDKPGHLEFAELPIPAIKADEVLVRVHAIDINPVDNKTLEGKGQYANIRSDDPMILGWDASGIIEATGKAVTRFQKGDPVFGLLNFPGHGRTYAQYVAAPASQIALKPGNIDHETAVASTLSALMAWQAIKEAGIKAGERVLIQGVAGGVGFFALRIAKSLGAHVIGTAMAQEEAMLRENGLDEFIDFQTTDFERVTRDIDFVFDTIGGHSVIKAFNILKPGGRLITIPSGVGDEWKTVAAERGINAKFLFVHSSGEDLAAIAELLEKGEIHPNIAHRFQMADIPRIHELMSARKIVGKIVVTID